MCTSSYAVAIDHLVQFILKDEHEHYFFSSIFSWPDNYHPDETVVGKYEVKRILYHSEVLDDSDKCIFKYSTKCLKLKLPGD